MPPITITSLDLYDQSRWEQPEPILENYPYLYALMATGSFQHLAANEQHHVAPQLDLSQLMQTAPARRKGSWLLLSKLLQQTLSQRCDQLTIEPDNHCWRLRFFAADQHIEQIAYDYTALQQLTDTLSAELKLGLGSMNTPQTLFADFKQQRYLVTVAQLPAVDGATYSMIIEPWQALPYTLDDLQLAKSIDRKIRLWLATPGGWLTFAGPSNKLNARGQRALLQACSSAESRLLYIAREHQYSLPRVTQIALDDIDNHHRDVVWRQVTRMAFDGFVLDGVEDQWLQTLTNVSDRLSKVMHTVNANNINGVMRRLQSLRLDQARFSHDQSAILMQYPVRLQCEYCKCPDTDTLPHKGWLDSWLPQDSSVNAWLNTRSDGFMAAHGCDRCDQTGLAHWVTLYDWLEFNDEIRTAIADDSWQSACSLLLLQQTVVQTVFKLLQEGSIPIAEARRVLRNIFHHMGQA